MKLLRWGATGVEKPGLLDANGTLRDLRRVVADINGDMLDAASLGRLAALDATTLPIVEGEQRLGACVAGVGKLIGIGLNYSDHAAEAGLAPPGEPIVFHKATSSICGPDDDLECPPGAKTLDWEVELGVVIGKRAKYVSKDAAMLHVAGYCTVNDASERDSQMKHLGQWTKGKSHDSFGPLGPWLVTTDEVPDPHNLRLTASVDGQVMQDGSTAAMIFNVPSLIAYLSRFMTLEPGDVIATGTPAGVGMGQKPQPIYLQPGQVLSLAVEGLGEQRHRVVALG